MSKAHVALLKQVKIDMVKGFVEDDWSNGICIFIEKRRKSYPVEAKQIKKYIRSALGSVDSASLWLYDALGISTMSYFVWKSRNQEAILKWRLRWVSKLIKVFKDVE